MPALPLRLDAMEIFKGMAENEAHEKLDDSANRLISRGQTKEKRSNAFERGWRIITRIDKGETMKNAFFVPFRRLL